MFLGSKIFILEILISLGVGPFSQAQVKAPPPPKKQIKVATKTAVKNVAAPAAKPQLVVAPVASVVTAEIKKPAPRTASAYELGVSYYMWNEKLKVSKGEIRASPRHRQRRLSEHSHGSIRMLFKVNVFLVILVPALTEVTTWQIILA